MGRRGHLFAQAILFGCLILPGSLAPSQQNSLAVNLDVQPEKLLVQPPAANWLSYNGDYTGRRFSSLNQINKSNVGQLRASWVFHAPNSSALEVTPVVYEGMMFVTSANDAYALDAEVGRIVWHYARPVTQDLIDDAAEHHNRGVALWHSRVYMETDNAHLLCLDARSGNLLWDVCLHGWQQKLRRH